MPVELPDLRLLFLFLTDSTADSRLLAAGGDEPSGLQTSLS